MLKKIISFLLTAMMLANVSVFAELRENDGVLTEDFEGYGSAGDITADDTLISDFTAFAPEVGTIGASQVMVVTSQSGADNMVFLNPAVFDGDINVFKCKIGADSSEKLNWGSASALVFSHTNENGAMVNDYIFDFAWSLVRHKENGTTEKSICGFTPKKLYSAELKATKTMTGGAYYYVVEYIVEGNKYSISFPTSEDGEMRIGFKSTRANKLYIDDIEAYSMDIVVPSVNVEGRCDVSVKPEIEVIFSGEVDEETLIPENIFAGDMCADKVENAGDNKYIITFPEALEKNTEYVFDISAVRDKNGAALGRSEFVFTTVNTSVVNENGEIINASSDESESITVFVPEYNTDGALVSIAPESLELAPGESYIPSAENYFVLTEENRPLFASVITESVGINNDAFEAVYDRAENVVTVSGRTAQQNADELISVTVQNSDGEYEYAGVTKTSHGGYFSISYADEMSGGVYKVFAKTMREEFSADIRLPNGDVQTNGESFDGLEDISGIIGGDKFLEEFTSIKPELEKIGENQVMTVSSVKGSDNIVYTNSVLSDNEVTVLKCKIGADSAPNMNWKSASALVFSYTSEAGTPVNEYIFDFAWSLVRHKENGKEAGIVGFTPKKLYNAEIKISKLTADNKKYYYNVEYTVDGKSYTTSFATTENGKMRMGFKSSDGNKLYVDDIEVSGYEFVKSDADVSGRSDVSVKPEIVLEFSDLIAEETLLTITAGDVLADRFENVGENKYIIIFRKALEKNTEYVLNLGGVRDMNGNSLKDKEFTFKTKNTAVSVDGGGVENTLSENGESVIIVVPIYDSNGTMTGKTITPYEIAPNETLVVEHEKFFVLTPDYKPIDSNVYVQGTGEKSDTFKAEFDSVNQKVNVAGKTDALYEELIAVTVMDADGVIDYSGITKTDKNGYFSISYMAESASGTYTVYAKSEQKDFTENVKIRLKTDISSVLSAVNSDNAGKIAEILSQYDEMLAIDIDLYAAADKQFIASELAKYDDYKTIEALVYDIEALALADAIKSVADKNSIFKNYEYAVLSTEDSEYEFWNKLSDSDKNSVLDSVVSMNSYKSDNFRKNVYIESILMNALGTNQYADVKKAIETHYELLGLDLSDYEKAGKPTSVAKGLCGTKWTISSFRDKFNQLVSAALKDNSGNKGSSGGGGGGGGGGGSSSLKQSGIAMPQSTPQPMEVVKTEPKKTEFTDIALASWAEEAVNSLAERKILSGYEDGSFRPNEGISREEFVTVIVRYLGIKTDSACDFADVSESDWFYPYVAAAKSNNIINGISETEFGVGRGITRQDASVILYNIGKIKLSDAELTFTDSEKIAAYAASAVAALSQSGIINGNPDGSFNPSGALTRAQAAKMIFEYDREVEG